MEFNESFTGVVSEIVDSTKDDEFLRGLALDIFYRNLPSEISKKIKSIHNNFSFNYRAKKHYQCQYRGCSDESCYSHDISENAFLKNLCRGDSEVVILKRNMKGNPIFSMGEYIHKRNATNFPGYCAKHDLDLFSDVEDGNQKLDDYFVNKQCLRSTRREIFEVECQINMGSDFVKTVLSENDENNILIIDIVGNFNRKIDALKKRRLNLLDLHEKIMRGIESKDYLVEFRELDAGKKGFCFSACLDLTLDEDEEECILYFYNLEFKNESKAFVCSLKNSLSRGYLDNFISNSLLNFSKIIFQKKMNLVFSKEFFEKISEGVKLILNNEPELYSINNIEASLISQDLFS
ncbi:hypothetical protein F3J24_01910 [Comamonas sp. Tr-654]|uniref:hypothetical protein n=1 Tax=Comamonas sp. Tr-654 TaxID=2608341 RepID=UPI001421314F|nr:hypothetical protein [Comamonas sp. Tr-654]NIF82267.1 hypothetical protein [Comamonas sp. Tr-654]